MKARLLKLPLVCFTVLTFSAASAHSQTVVTFDDLPSSFGGAFISTGYQGLSWSNFAVCDAFLQVNDSGTNGYIYGMVSASNVAFNAGGSPAEIDAHGTNFDLLSTYLTGAWNSNLNIEVQGFRSGTLLYNTTVVVSATSPTLFTFNYLDIDRLYFNSFGGEPAFDGIDETQFVMDNLTFEFIPEPSSLLLAALGSLSLWAFLRPKRV
jgi:PEP-CTERM motif